jgi:G3E family GTPase
MTPIPKSSAVPVTIITGFLGAGKTTLLNHILHAEHGLRVAVLVNDFGAINIDAKLVANVEGDMINLANGCICCTIRDDLLKAALRLLDRDDKPEYIIVECSGVSDPVSVAQTFMMPELRQWLQVDSILAVVDADQLDTLTGQDAYLALEQLSVADIIVLNKVDLVSPEKLAKLKREWAYPQARIVETTYANVPLPLVLGVGSFTPDRFIGQAANDIHVHEDGAAADHDHAHDQADHSMVFSTWNWTTDDPVSLPAIRKVSRELPVAIYRAKGILNLAESPDRKAILQVVGNRVKVTISDPWGDETPRTEIVVIGAYGAVHQEKLRKLFDSTLAKHLNVASKLANTVSEWFRGEPKVT